jgi:hypothetical protein
MDSSNIPSAAQHEVSEDTPYTNSHGDRSAPNEALQVQAMINRSVEKMTKEVLGTSPTPQRRCEPPPEAPTTPGQIFCQPRTRKAGETTKLFRLRDGNPEFIATFLARSTGLETASGPSGRELASLALLDPPAHLVEVIQYFREEETMLFERRYFYCAIGESCALSSGAERTVLEYSLLSPLAPMCFMSGRVSHDLSLDSSCIIKCGSCDRWYEIRVYR